MKHKTFSKENERKFKQIIKAQKDEIRRLEIEVRELKKNLACTDKVKKSKEPKPPKENTKQVDKIPVRQKVSVQMTEEQRKKFCSDFSARFKQGRLDGKPDSAD